ncbi:M14 family zinc carboxypeptidase [Olleya sp. YS]|uniref:M14 family zinc carboxypeptidase n=1 Tax=Olleya sp. YS TaxID=3028318 RepID=UPI0024341500|nr:M14 family zinc carboxypeptidase [Olleya sp. YS]WGD34600.1 M14 family zinc carboxypeptidase [Olleya sp. YS]
MNHKTIKYLFNTYKEDALFGRYIRLEDINPLIKNLPSKFNIDCIGQSVLNQDIYSITFGLGHKKILMWSQMHGNESTTTKAIFDVLKTFKNNQFESILKACTIKIIPMLNPDGAEVYTRLNANLVDLNRDAQDLSQPESKVLRSYFEEFKPDFCFNLHGQRTMYSVGNTNHTATLSFLSPAEDKQRHITETRKKAMEVIVHINNALQNSLPNQTARYDDSFNANCVGDTFQALQVPTVLFEAGHYKNDYIREQVRGFVFEALLEAIQYIAKNDITGEKYQDYLKIPENGKRFYDVIIRNGQFGDRFLDVGINYQEQLIEKNVKFIPEVMIIEDLSKFYGHKELNANGSEIFTSKNQPIQVGYSNDFVTVNNVKLSLNL